MRYYPQIGRSHTYLLVCHLLAARSALESYGAEELKTGQACKLYGPWACLRVRLLKKSTLYYIRKTVHNPVKQQDKPDFFGQKQCLALD